MTASKRVRFPTQALAPDGSAHPRDALPLETIYTLRRLSGFCLAHAGAYAFCLDDDGAVRSGMAALRPSLQWQDAVDDSRPLDLIVANGALQRLWSETGSWAPIQAFLKQWIDRLAPGGRIVLRENALLTQDRQILLELPDYRQKIDGETDPSRFTVQRLMDYAATARPFLHTDYRGFFIEEVAPIRPHTRLFRLPLKWAAEFVRRMDLSEEAWQDALKTEFFLGDEDSFRRQILYQLGLRVVVSAPHWGRDDASDIRHYRLYNDDDKHTQLPPPPSEITYVLEKPEAEESLWITEQRLSGDEPAHLGLAGMRHEHTGDDQTLVTGLDSLAQLLPWRRLDNGALGVFLHADQARPLANVWPRKTNNIDGRRFSTHMAEPLELPINDWHKLAEAGVSGIAKWLVDTTGLHLSRAPEPVHEGRIAFPAPDFIDQAITTVFMEVRDDLNDNTFDMLCFDASDVLQAIHAGLLPCATLEAQLWQLSRHTEMPILPLTDRKIELPVDETADDRLETTAFEELCRKLMPDEHRQKAPSFKPIKGHDGDWRVARSVFVEETLDGPRQAREQEFVLNEDAPLHRAALLCLARRHDGEAFAGFDMVDCPVPSRYGKPGTMVRLPSIPLPGDLRSVPETRQYIADVLEVKVEEVVPCGEAVFTQVGVTPQKIFPFIVTKAPSRLRHPRISYAPITYIDWITHLDNSDSFLWKWGLALAYLGDGTEFSLVNKWELRNKGGSRTITEAPLRAVGHHLS